MAYISTINQEEFHCRKFLSNKNNIEATNFVTIPASIIDKIFLTTAELFLLYVTINSSFLFSLIQPVTKSF